MKRTLAKISHWTVIEVDQSSGMANIELPTKKYAEYLLLEEKFKEAQIELRKLLISVNPALESSFR